MIVNKKRDSLTNKLLSVDMTDIKADDFVELMLLLRLRQEHLEKEIEECGKEELLKRFIPDKEKELKNVNKLIEIMEVQPMLEVVIPSDKNILERQIKALKYAIEHDIREVDKQIHSQALERLEKALKVF